MRSVCVWNKHPPTHHGVATQSQTETECQATGEAVRLGRPSCCWLAGIPMRPALRNGPRLCQACRVDAGMTVDPFDRTRRKQAEREQGRSEAQDVLWGRSDSVEDHRGRR